MRDDGEAAGGVVIIGISDDKTPFRASTSLQDFAFDVLRNRAWRRFAPPPA
jgi:hypothetical protein